MKTVFAVLFGLVIALCSAVPYAAASNGGISDVRYGEHPYETRTRQENMRKQIAKDVKKYGYFVPVNDTVYYDPIFAKRSVLHPFYRKGGMSQYIDGRYAGWRGYQDPVTAHTLSPDTYCQNFYYQRLPNRGAPKGFECF